MSSIASAIACPHCLASNAAGAQYCEACGMALPLAAASGPRVVDSKSFASTSAGQQLQAEELHKQQKKASGALLAVAIIRTVLIGIVVALAASRTGRMDLIFRVPIVLILGAIALLFWGLYIWSRSQPLPAAIVGMIVYATLLSINIVFSVSQLSQHGPRAGNGLGGIGIWWIDIIILAVLARAISAGLKYRKMLQGGIA